jgi:outer membrane protein
MKTKTSWRKPAKILALFVLLTTPALAQDKITLEQAVAKAMENNPELAIDKPALEAARSESAAARAGYLPRLDLEQSFLSGNNPVYVFGTLLTQQKFTANNFALPSLNAPDALHNLQTKLTAQQTIWDAGQTSRNLQAGRMGVEITEHAREDHVRQTLMATLQAYYSVSLSRKVWDTAVTALNSAEAIVNQAQARVDSGLAIEADLLRSRVYLAAARQVEIQTRGQLETAKAVLNRIMGAALDAPQGETQNLNPAVFNLPSEEALLASMKQRRPDYQKLLVEARQAELEVRSRRSQYLPQIGAFASWEADNPSFVEAGGTNWSGGIALRWNIFSGGSDAALLRAARQRLEQKELEVKAMESAMALEIRKALIQCKSADQQVKAMEASETQSAESLRILRNRYDAGLATITDLLAVEATVSAARSGLAEALYLQRISVAQAEFAAGTLSPTSAAMR